MKQKREDGMKTARLTARQAVMEIPDGATVAICGAGGGLLEPTEIINALADRFREQGSPGGLTLYHTTGMGDRGDRGMSVLALEGLVRRIFGGHWAQSPRLAEMAARGEIEAYNYPQGILAQLLRTAAAGQPGILSKVGLGTFLDPRQQGGRLNGAATREHIRLMELDGEQYLFYPAVPIDVAVIRATTSDTEGYLTMEDEIAYLDVLAMAQAAHNRGGIVLAQVQRVVRAGSLHPKDVRVPGYLVDAVVEVPDQPQLYGAPVNRFFSGDFVMDTGGTAPAPLDLRKVIARRALLEVRPGDIGNVGVGVADGVGVAAREEGVEDMFTLTVETGPVGGVTAQGIYFGASVNMRALLDMPAQFDFYDGGGLDICFLSFAEVDASGNVNVHKFGGKIVGTGGFVNISQFTGRVVFCGAMTAGGLEASIERGALRINREGRLNKLVQAVSEITFNGPDAIRRGQQVLYVTERAVFHLTEQGLQLREIAPGVDLERDILGQMAFTPLIAPELREMDPRLFLPGIMGLADTWRPKTNKRSGR